MKTTIELPDPLVRQIKQRALDEGKKLKDVVADLLQKGLADPDRARSSSQTSHLTVDKRSGLPLIRCVHPAARERKLTPDRIAEVLLDQEVAWQDKARR